VTVRQIIKESLDAVHAHPHEHPHAAAVLCEMTSSAPDAAPALVQA
jgi:hypothetical protein